MLKAGGAYLPLDPNNPAERLQFVMEDSGTEHLITTSSLAGNVPATFPPSVLLDVDREAILSQPSTTPDTAVRPQDLAYCIYTSGSTGKPKGALIEHRNVVRLMVNDRLQFTFTSDDVWTMFHSYSFDFSVWEMYGALLYGGKLVVVPEQVSKDPTLFFDLLVDEKITVLNQTPTAFYNLASLDQGQSLALRYIIFGGEALRPALLQEWKAARPEVKLINMYGITETTVHVTFKEIDAEHISTDTSNIGVPIPTTTTYIFDDELRLLPVGVPGEICVGGSGVCRGYLNRDELTRRKFVANPYKPQEIIYRSGDLGKLLPAGEMVYMGRSDDQVQIRGFRVEPGEVQSQLLTHPSIARAEVIAKTMHHGAVELVAYVVASGNLDVTELRTHVASALPHYMVPSAFVFIDEFPLTPNGKIDRRALPEPNQMRPELGAAFVAPRTPTEEILASIWAGVLGRETIGVHDNFFELGGHSLLATQVISRVRDAFGQEVALRSLFEQPTVAGLAKEIEAVREVGAQLQAPPLERVERAERLPLSFAQQRLWFLDQLEPDSSFYNIPAAVRLHGVLNVEALEQTLSEVVRRHEVLRTHFIAVDGEPVQVIDAAAPIKLVVVELSELDEAERAAETQRLVEAESTRPFDLSRGPLLRMSLLRLGAEEHVVLLTMHHIVSDGWSMGVLIGEVATLYGAYLRGEESPLEELPIQYADFAHWQRSWLQGEVLDTQLDYWRAELADAPTVIDLPDRQTSSTGADLSWRLSAAATFNRTVGTTARAQPPSWFDAVHDAAGGLRPVAVSLCGTGTGVSRYTDREPQSLGDGRVDRVLCQHAGAAGDVRGNPSFRELLRRVRETALAAYAHQDLPFEKLVEELQPERDMSRSPLFQVMMVLQNAPGEALELEGLSLSGVESAGETTKFELMLGLQEIGGRVVGGFNYDRDLYEAETIGRLAASYERMLQAVVADAEQRVFEIQLLNEAERWQLIKSWNETEVEYPRALTVSALFEAQAARTPAAVALRFEDTALSYAELNGRANQLARYLQRTGVGPDVLVGVLMDRSVELVVALLGILKAGGAYVPLDPMYPAERLAFMVQDSGLRLLLAQERLRELAGASVSERLSLDQQWDAGGW